MKKPLVGRCPHNPSCSHRILHNPRYTALAFDETELPPLGPPRSDTGDLVSCGRLVDFLEWVSRDIQGNLPMEYPAILIRSLQFLVDPRTSVHNPWRRGSPFPRYLHFDTRDPITIFGHAIEDLLTSAQAAIRVGDYLDEQVLHKLCCRIDMAMALKGDTGIDTRFDVLEALLMMLDELRIFCGVIEYATL